MRWTSTIFTALSLVLLLLVAFFYARSYARFDGLLHFDEHGKPGAAIATNGRDALRAEFTGRSSGFISYRGHLTYVSITNPVRAEDWEGWSVPVDQPYAQGPMNIVWDVREIGGLKYGSGKTQSGLVDPVYRVAWQLPFQYLTIPYWLLVLALAILPYLWLTAYRRALRRERAGQCVRCGKDVKGLTGKCPACGQPIP
jgi:hypothetical protein